MKIFKLLTLAIAFTAVLASGCASARNNIVYRQASGNVIPVAMPVKGTIINVTDAREEVRVYPKRVIKEISYSGDVSYDINDRTVEDVFTQALEVELGRVGVSLVRVIDIPGPLNKDTAEEIRRKLQTEYPDIKVAFAADISSFMAESKRGLVTKDINVKASMRFYVLDVATGDSIWSDFDSDFNDMVAPTTADHNYMIDRLDEQLTDLMARGVKDNTQLRDFLTKISARQP